MKLVVSTKAQREIRDATVWYEEQARGLSAEFLRAIELSLVHVQRNPLLFAETLRACVELACDGFHTVFSIVSARKKSLSWPACTSTATRKTGHTIER